MNKKILIVIASVVFVSGIAAVTMLLSGPRMKTQPSLRSFEAPVPQPPAQSVAFNKDEFGSRDLNLPLSSEENMQKGKIYYDYFCVFCHGEDGKGNGPVGKSYNPKPADLTADSIMTHTTEELYKKSFLGTGHSPVLERVVPEDYRAFILAYIKETF